MTPWLDDGDVRLYHGDAAGVLASLPAGMAQTCVTSPPYWGLRDYGTGAWTGGSEDCDHTAPAMGDPDRPRALTGKGVLALPQGISYKDVCGRCGARRVDSQLGLEATPDAYVARLVAVFREVWRVLRADGTLWLNLGDSYHGGGYANHRVNGEAWLEAHGGDRRRTRQQDRINANPELKPKDLVGIPWRVAFALQADGWYLRSDIIWAKPNPMPESVTDRPTKAHEYVFLLSKQPRYFYDADAIRETALQPLGEPRLTGSQQAEHGGSSRVINGGAPSTLGTNQGAAGRNARSVWEIATQPTPEAHFATYPEALVRRCILAGTSERGECAECGAPWQRQTEAEYVKSPAHGAGSIQGSRGAGRDSTHLTGGRANKAGVGDQPRVNKQVTTTGWAASCSCGAPTQPQRVLDPFIGSGTTALVARHHARHAIGIDLSAAYLDIAARRLGQLSLLSKGVDA